LTGKQIVLSLCFLFCASICWGQMGAGGYTYNGHTIVNESNPAPNYSFTNNIPNCVSGKNMCWHLGNVTLGAATSGNQQTGGTDSTGHPYLFSDYPTNHWTLQTAMGTVHQFAIGDVNQMWSLGAPYPGGGYYVQQWSGTAWVYPPYGGVLMQLAEASGGTICGANSAGNGFYNLGSGWQLYPLSSWIWISCTPGNLEAVGIKSDRSVWIYKKSTGTWTQTTGYADQASIDAATNIYVLASGNVYHYNSSNGTWDLLAGGPFTSLANGGTMNVWAVTPTGLPCGASRITAQLYPSA